MAMSKNTKINYHSKNIELINIFLLNYGLNINSSNNNIFFVFKDN